MSELKAINAYQLTTNTEDSDVYIHNDEFGCGGDLVECYIKADADQVIAEKEQSIASWIGAYEASRRINARTESKLRHHKYKRCLAMKWWCASRAVVWNLDCNEKKSEWYWKWKERWKELAEKFKEAE